MKGRLKLIQIVSEQAQRFMRETGGLLPFAVVLDCEDEVRQLMLDWEEEHPNTRELAVALEAVVKVRLRFNSILGGVICTDMLYRTDAQSAKQDALGMKLLMRQEAEHYFQPYVTADQVYVFADIIQDNMEWDQLSQLSE